MEFQGIADEMILLQILFIGGFMLFGVLGFVFWIWMLVDCLKYESSVGNEKLVWALVIVLTNWIGALIYFFVRRAERRRIPVGRQHQRMR